MLEKLAGEQKGTGLDTNLSANFIYFFFNFSFNETLRHVCAAWLGPYVDTPLCHPPGPAYLYAELPHCEAQEQGATWAEQSDAPACSEDTKATPEQWGTSCYTLAVNLRAGTLPNNHWFQAFLHFLLLLLGRWGQNTGATSGHSCCPGLPASRWLDPRKAENSWKRDLPL